MWANLNYVDTKSNPLFSRGMFFITPVFLLLIFAFFLHTLCRVSSILKMLSIRRCCNCWCRWMKISSHKNGKKSPPFSRKVTGCDDPDDGSKRYPQWRVDGQLGHPVFSRAISPYFCDTNISGKRQHTYPIQRYSVHMQGRRSMTVYYEFSTFPLESSAFIIPPNHTLTSQRTVILPVFSSQRLWDDCAPSGWQAFFPSVFYSNLPTSPQMPHWRELLSFYFSTQLVHESWCCQVPESHTHSDRSMLCS